ncbi:hypothetical protein PR003_g33403, partial [Phytophthora rubi]
PAVSWLGHSKAELFVALADAHLDLLFEGLGVVKLLAHNELLTKFLAGYTCTAIDDICGSAISLLFGTTTSLNISHVPVLISQTPAGTSVKDIAHFAQGIRADTFARFDYGCSCVQALGLSLCASGICPNKAKYGSFAPPAYVLRIPVYWFPPLGETCKAVMQTSREGTEVLEGFPRSEIVLRRLFTASDS